MMVSERMAPCQCGPRACQPPSQAEWPAAGRAGTQSEPGSGCSGPLASLSGRMMTMMRPPVTCLRRARRTAAPAGPGPGRAESDWVDVADSMIT